MRRKDREITDYNQMIEIMEKCDCCRIGLIDEFGAYIVPMNFGYEKTEENLVLYFHSSTEGKKIEILNKQKIVSFEMDTKHNLVCGKDRCDYSFLFQSIMGRGTVEIMQNLDEKIYGLQKLMKHYTDKEKWKFKEKILKNTIVIKLNVAEWTCKEHKQ